MFKIKYLINTMQCNTLSQQVSLIEINQNVIILFTIHAICNRLRLNLGIPNFNFFGHSHNYDATIGNFILLVGSILHLFSSIHRSICPINHNSHQISCIFKIFYNDIGVYLNVCTKILYIYIYIICICMYIVHIMNFKNNI